MAANRDKSTLSYQVTADTAAAKAQLDATFERTFTLKVGKLDLPSKAEMQAQLDAKIGTSGLKAKVRVNFDVSEADLAPVYKSISDAQRRVTKVEAEEEAKRGTIRARGLADSRKIADKLAADQIRLAEQSAEALKVIAADLYADQERILDNWTDYQRREALKQAGVWERYTQNRKLLQAQIQAAVTKSELQITAREVIEAEKRLTVAESEAERRETIAERLAASLLLLENRTNAQLTVERERAAERSNRAIRDAALRREVIEAQTNARLLVAEDAFQKRRVLSAEAAQRRIQEQANKPILQTILVNTDRINGSLNDFDRTVSRVLRTSLLSFTAWSAGVTALFGAVAVAGVAAYSKLEISAARAGAVVASDEFNKSLLKNGQGITNFADVAEKAQQRIINASNKVALDTLFGPTDVTEGVRSLLQAGQSLTQALQSIGPAANFAQINELDLSKATEGLAAGLAASGTEAKDSGKLLDKFAFVAQNALGDAGDYMTAFANKAAAAGKSFHYSNDEVLTLLELLGQTGTLGEDAGTQANIVLRELARGAGRAGDAWKKYGIEANGSLNEQIVQIGKVAEAAFKAKGRAGVAGLAQELGLTYKSISSILQVLPQANKLGLDGLNKLTKGIEKSGGAVQRQSEQIKKTISFQFGNLIDTLRIAFAKFGQAASSEVTAVFDKLAGSDGLIARATPTIIKFGHQFGAVIARFGKFLDTDNFTNGIKTLVLAVQVGIKGMGDALGAFSSAFANGRDAGSTFEAIANSILAFSRLAARVLPVVARLIGNVLDTLVRHADAFETFAKIALGVYAVRKAYTLLIKPALEVGRAIGSANKALKLWAAAETLSPVKAAAVSVAESFGIVTRSAQAATTAVDALAIAETNAAASSAVKAAKDAASAGALQRVQVSARGTGGLDAFAGGLEANSARAAAGRARAQQAANAGMVASLGAQNAVLETQTSLLSRVALGFSRVAASAGKLSIIAAIAVAATGAFKGLYDGITATIHTSDSAREGFSAMGSALKGVADAAVIATGIVFSFGELLGGTFGAVLGTTVGAVTDLVQALNSLVHLDWNGLKKNVGELGGDFGGLISYVQGAMDKFDSSIPGFDYLNGKASDLGRSIRGIFTDVGPQPDLLKDSLDKLSSSLDKAQTAAYNASKGVYSIDPATGKVRRSIDQTSLSANSLKRNFQLAMAALQSKTKSATGAAKKDLDSLIRKLLASSAKAREVFAQLKQDQAVADETAKIPTPGGTLDITSQGFAGRNALNSAAVVKANKALRAQARAHAASARDAVNQGISDASSDKGTKAEFVDPDEIIQKRIDAMKPAKRIAETQAAIAKVLKAGGRGYNASRQEVLLFQAALPGLQKELDKQTKSVSALDDALGKLKDTQLEGTKAFSDAQFALDQQSKALQLQKLDLQIGGAKDTDPRIVALDKQIEDLSKQAERSNLVESLQLDPLKKQLDETFNPKTEASITSILDQFTKLTAQREAANTKLSASQKVQDLVNAAVEAGSAKYDKLDTAAQQAASAVQGVATASNAAAGGVRNYSTAVEAVPSGKGVVDKSLAQINTRVTELAAKFTGAGARVTNLFSAGITGQISNRLQPALNSIVTNASAYLQTAANMAPGKGVALMDGFLLGMEQKFGADTKAKGTVAYFLNVFIPQWIRDNKGPVAYDATILVPAGHAVMEGFDKGLRSGFSGIQDFVKGVGPSIGEAIDGSAFSKRTATFMADIALGKTPDIDKVFGDLKGQAELGLPSFVGPVDPHLSFLHRTDSLADTKLMAAQLGRLFGLQVTSTTGGKHAAGSQHYLGQAADLSNSSGGGDNPASNTPQMGRAFQELLPFVGSVIKQLIYRNRIYGENAGPIGGHQNHVHVGFRPDASYSEFSGKFGKSLALPKPLQLPGGRVIPFPGASSAVDAAISAAATKNHLDALLLGAIAFRESSFNPRAQSRDGGKGLFQLTSQGYINNANRLGGVFNPFANAEAGAEALAQKIRDAGGDVALGVKHYNGGGPAATAYVGRVFETLEKFRKQFGGFREKGGPTQAGKSYVVGEAGREIFTPATNGSITTNAETERILSGGSSTPHYVDNSVTNINSGITDPDVLEALVAARKKRKMVRVNAR